MNCDSLSVDVMFVQMVLLSVGRTQHCDCKVSRHRNRPLGTAHTTLYKYPDHTIGGTDPTFQSAITLSHYYNILPLILFSSFPFILDTPLTPAPKAIGSLAKKQADVTRQGTQKLKFVPTLPQRRKKE